MVAHAIYTNISLMQCIGAGLLFALVSGVITTVGAFVWCIVFGESQ